MLYDVSDKELWATSFPGTLILLSLIVIDARLLSLAEAFVIHARARPVIYIQWV